MDAIFGMLGMFTIFISVIFLMVNLIRKKPKKKICIALLVGIGLFIIGLLIPSGTEGDLDSNKNIQCIELSDIIGESVEKASELKNIKFIDAEEKDLNGYSAIYTTKDEGVLIGVDDKGRIAAIDIKNDGYSLFGINQKMDLESTEKALAKAGFEKIEEYYYRQGDTYNIIDLTNSIMYIQDRLNEDLILQCKTTYGYEYRLPTTVRAVYIGNGQMLEYAKDSVAAFEYSYSESTSVQKESGFEKYDGVYFRINGKVTDVYNDSISIYVYDESLTESEGKMFPISYIVPIDIVPEEQGILNKIKSDSDIEIYAQLDLTSTKLPAYSHAFRNGIITRINDSHYTAPIINSVMSGIYRPNDETNNTVQPQGETFDNASTPNGDKSVNSVEAAINAVKKYVEKEGYSDPYDMYEGVAYAGYYEVYAGHSYRGDDWQEATFFVDELNYENVSLHFEDLNL